jgi:hypothetical protein
VCSAYASFSLSFPLSLSLSLSLSLVASLFSSPAAPFSHAFYTLVAGNRFAYRRAPRIVFNLFIARFQRTAVAALVRFDDAIIVSNRTPPSCRFSSSFSSPLVVLIRSRIFAFDTFLFVRNSIVDEIASA